MGESMFHRVAYKKLAKKQLKGRMKTAVLATLVTVLLTGITGSPGSFAHHDGDFISPSENHAHLVSFDEYEYFYEDEFFDFDPFSHFDFFQSFLILAVSGICMLAMCHLFNEYFRRPDAKIPFSEFIKGFSLWLSGIVSMMWFFLWVFLWSLLFFIPGIVKAFSYSQMFFIIAENPKISVPKAMRISKIITRGCKADIFVMSLSFIGWEILSVCTLFVLQLWVTPYEYMSFTNAYKDMKSQAIRKGLLTEEDFS